MSLIDYKLWKQDIEFLKLMDPTKYILRGPSPKALLAAIED